MSGWVGRFYEDFTVGETIAHGWARTVTEADNHLFTLLTGNTMMAHVNDEYASRTEFGKPLMNSTFTLALITGISVRDVSENAIANLAWSRIDILAPVFAGDTLYAQSTVLSARESRSRPEAGIVEVETLGYNGSGEHVLRFRRAVLVYRRGFGPRRQWPTPAPAGGGKDDPGGAAGHGTPSS